MTYVQWECCTAVAVTQDQKFILENVLPVNRKYKVQEFNIVKENLTQNSQLQFLLMFVSHLKQTRIQVITSI